MAYLALSVTGMMNRVRIETLKLVRREQDAPLMSFNLCKEVLLLVIMSWCHVACDEGVILIEHVTCFDLRLTAGVGADSYPPCL